MLKAVFLILFILPLVFQIVFGVKSIIKSEKLKLWHIGLISLIGQIIIMAINFQLMAYFSEQAGSHDGLPFVGIIALSAVLTAVVVVVYIVQSIVNYRLNLR